MSTIGVNPLVVGRLPGGTNAWTGVYLAEDIQLLDQGVQNGSWVDATLGGVGTALDALGLITDPLGALVSWGVAWLMEHVKPLSDALDKLAGDPNQIAANVQTWRNVSADLDLLAGDYRTAVSRNAQLWQGPAGEAYLRYATDHHAALDGLAKAAGMMALITEGAGMLVAMVRTLVRDAIAEFVLVLAVRLWEWLAEERSPWASAHPGSSRRCLRWWPGGARRSRISSAVCSIACAGLPVFCAASARSWTTSSGCCGCTPAAPGTG